MKTPNIAIKNPGPVLHKLLKMIPGFNNQSYLYVGFSTGPIAANLDFAGLHQNALGLKDRVLPEILQLLGIRSLTLTSIYDFGPLIQLSRTESNDTADTAVLYLQNMQLIKELQRLFQNCRSVAFDDWATVIDAAELWSELLTAVLLPLEKDDLEFIFYLGNSGGKLSFQVEEALKTISDFSANGQVTLALDEDEASSVWRILNGVPQVTTAEYQTQGDLKKRYFSIFNSIGVARLLIYSTNSATMFSDTDQFLFSRKTVSATTEIASNARHNFVEGYSIGLLFNLDLTTCVALGLIVFGTYGDRDGIRDQKAVLKYIEKWIDDLDRPDSIYLYQ